VPTNPIPEPVLPVPPVTPEPPQEETPVEPSEEGTGSQEEAPVDTPPSDTPSDNPDEPTNPQDTPESSDNQPTDSSTDSSTDTEPTPTEEPSQPTDPEETDENDESSDTQTSEEEPLPTPDNQEQENQSQESQNTPIDEPKEEESTPEAVLADALADGKLTAEEKAAVVTALVADLAPGEAVSSETLIEAGLTYEDLPPATPVDVRADENGNPVIITAEVAAALELIENPSELIGALFEDPGQVLLALGSLGADMSPQEREEAQKTVVATVIAAGAAINAVAAAGGVTRKG
jgi:hypothetical protein